MVRIRKGRLEIIRTFGQWVMFFFQPFDERHNRIQLYGTETEKSLKETAFERHICTILDRSQISFILRIITPVIALTTAVQDLKV